jgi:hypothetical protein
VTLSVNTEGYEGEIYESAYVYTNEPGKPRVELGIKAFVEVAISVRPKYVLLVAQGRGDAAVTRVVEIKGALDQPLQLEPVKFDLEEKALYRIEEVERGRLFRVHFTAVPGVEGSYRGSLGLKTNYVEKPEITIKVTGRFPKKER